MIGPIGTFTVVSSAQGQASQGNRQGSPLIKECCLRDNTTGALFKALYDKGALGTSGTTGGNTRPAGLSVGGTVVYDGLTDDAALMSYEQVPVKQP